MEENDKVIIDELEKLRSGIQKKMKLFFLIWIPAVICFVGIFFLIPDLLPFIGIAAIISFSTLIGFLIYYSVLFRNFRVKFKTKIVQDVLSRDMENITYNPNRFIDKETAHASSLIRIGNRYSGSDLITGKYKGVNFSTSDITSLQVNSNGKDTTTTVLFQGRFFAYDFNKSFNGELYIYEKSFGFSPPISRGLAKCEFEDIEFSEMFAVKSTDEHLAFYIVTPQFLVAFKKLNAAVKGTFMFSFKNGMMNVAIGGAADSLEPKISKRIDEMTYVNIRNEISIIKWFVDILSLDNEMFKKK